MTVVNILSSSHQIRWNGGVNETDFNETDFTGGLSEENGEIPKFTSGR